MSMPIIWTVYLYSQCSTNTGTSTVLVFVQIPELETGVGIGGNVLANTLHTGLNPQ